MHGHFLFQQLKMKEDASPRFTSITLTLTLHKVKIIEQPKPFKLQQCLIEVWIFTGLTIRVDYDYHGSDLIWYLEASLCIPYIFYITFITLHYFYIIKAAPENQAMWLQYNYLCFATALMQSSPHLHQDASIMQLIKMISMAIST